MSSQEYSLAEIAEKIGATLQGNPLITIRHVGVLNKAQSGEITFLDNKDYKKFLSTTKASAVILHPDNVAECPTAALVTEEPYVAFARVTALFSDAPEQASGIHPTVIIGNNCEIAEDVRIGPYTVIGDRVVIGAGTTIGSHCAIGNDCKIGEANWLYDRVTLYYGTTLGREVTIHSGAVLGADGFGFANEKGAWVKVYQLGQVVIGNQVEIGANTTIDRGAIENTTVADQVIIDDQVHLAHNVKIGKGTAIAGCTGIAGSTTIGNYCQLGGAVIVNAHISVTDQVKVVPATVLYRSIDKPGVYASPIVAQPFNDWLKCLAIYQKLPEIAKRFNILEKGIQAYLDGSLLSKVVSFFKRKK